MDLLGKTAIVTGAGGAGSGGAIARRLAREGAAVVAADVDERGGRETVRAIREAGGRAEFVLTDVRHEADAKALMLAAEEAFGGVHILVNNASAAVFPEDSLEKRLTNIEVDLLGTLYCMHHAIETMRRGGGGAIVNIGSVSALCHGGRVSKGPGYDTAKAGIMRLTTTLGPLAQSDGIRVNCLVPGWIATPHVKQYWESLTPEQRQTQKVPEMLISLEEIADGVVRLIADESLAGRVMVCWNGRAPGLIPVGDPGYVGLE